MNNQPLISVVIPAYNEAKRIGGTLLHLKRYFAERMLSHEIIVVSDGAKDETVEVVKEIQKDFPALRLIANDKNRGKGYAVKCGMLSAQGEYLLFMDADNSVTIETIEPFLDEMWREGDDIVIGSIAFKFEESKIVDQNGWHRRFFGTMSKFLIRVVATPGIYDTQRGFKLFTRKAAEKIFPLQRIDRFGFDIEILAIARMHGFAVKELPVEWNNPPGSTVRLRAYVDTFVELWNIQMNILSGVYGGKGMKKRTRARAILLFIIEFPALMFRLLREILISDQVFAKRCAEEARKFGEEKFRKFLDDAQISSAGFYKNDNRVQ